MEETEHVMKTDRALSSYRAAVAVELRMAGADYDEIAQELGFANRSGAWKAVQRALESRTVNAVDRYRMTRYAELEAGHRNAWLAARLGDSKAVDRCLRMADERTKLLGLL